MFLLEGCRRPGMHVSRKLKRGRMRKVYVVHIKFFSWNCLPSVGSPCMKGEKCLSFLSTMYGTWNWKNYVFENIRQSTVVWFYETKYLDYGEKKTKQRCLKIWNRRTNFLARRGFIKKTKLYRLAKNNQKATPILANHDKLIANALKCTNDHPYKKPKPLQVIYSVGRHTILYYDDYWLLDC